MHGSACPQRFKRKSVASSWFVLASASLSIMLYGCGATEPATHESHDTQSESTQQLFDINVINPSFETGVNTYHPSIKLAPGSNFQGWTIGGGGIDLIISLWQAADGSRSVDLNATSAGSITQFIDVELPTFPYTVYFSMAGNPDCGGGEKRLRVEAAGQSQEFSFNTTGKTRGNMGWQNFTFSFVPSATRIRLVFRSLTDGACGPAIDHISIHTI
ncbi:choice-of-anchor C family protein [Myxococcus sp. CA040A]|uniref:choice-of-anchor C family protein n=1 Tax=Myxococcus sp. CA040A TaxID=2741738 RepID=UPI00157B6A49|nr:choice-of-anchor C family protein [Myxococcus sp. CA040A]NTX08295.1 choice-of-anchor C family protein [Myxococcus sp. CA040A]